MSSSTMAGRRKAATSPKTSRAAAPLADSESRRVIREELLTNILVEAGAGSGKTQMLAERMAAGVAAGVYRIEHMAAVTFTRKAASELRGRFQLALEQKLLPDSRGFRLQAEEEQRVRAALSNLERFFAGTIHSFCARLLRERPVESGVSPGFSELDEVQDLELRKRAWRDFVTSTRAVGDADMMALIDADIRPSDLDSAFATICLHEDVEFPPGNAERPDPKAAWKACEKFWKDLQKELPSQIHRDTTCAIQKAARDFSALLNVSRYRLDRPSVVAALLEKWDCESKIVQKWWSDDKDEKKRLRDLIQPLHAAFVADTLEPYLAQWRQYVYRLSVNLLTRAREHAARERRRANALNYGDLLILAARVLRENTAVRRSLQQKYRHLFVDEFQDTDPVQAELVFLLAADERAGAPKVAVGRTFRCADDVGRSFSCANWRTVPLRPGALFVVGDPKQSIYRFRRADIDIYNIVRARFAEPSIGRVVTLTTNFRSVPELCAWANDVFETRFPEDPTAHAPRFAALDAHETSRSGGVFTLTHSVGGKDELLHADADRIATYIRSEVDAGRRTFSEFLILTRKKRDRIVPYARALEALNIPIEVSGAGAFGESDEVAALTVLLRALSDPQDQLSLIAVLRGPLFGISDRELFAYKQSGGWFSIFAPAGDSPESLLQTSDTRGFRLLDPRSLGEGGQAEGNGASSHRDRVSEALTALRQYHRWTRLLPAAAALDRILEHTGYLALAATTPGGVEAGDVIHAVDRVRQVVEEGNSLAEAADALEEDAEERNEVESLPLEPGRADVVRVMNLHKAKGLEANVVFLADPAGGFAPRVDVHIQRTDQKPHGWFQVTRRNEDKPWMSTVLGEHADWEAHKAAELPYLEAEQDRLLYVAATRAREMLVVSRTTANIRSEPAWDALNDFLDTAKELPVPSSVSAAPVAVLDCSRLAEATAALLVVHDRVVQPSWSVTSVTAEAHHIARMTRVADFTADDPTRVVSPGTSPHRADAGMAWGTLIHGLLEHAMRHPRTSPEDLRRLAVWLTVEEPQLRAVLDEALATVESVRREDFWRAAKSAEHSEETPFTVAAGRSVANGVVDLLHRGSEGWCVTDYKTDADGGALNRAAYELQTTRYREALEACGLDVENVALASVRSTTY